MNLGPGDDAVDLFIQPEVPNTRDHASFGIVRTISNIPPAMEITLLRMDSELCSPFYQILLSNCMYICMYVHIQRATTDQRRAHIISGLASSLRSTAIVVCTYILRMYIGSFMILGSRAAS